MKVLGELFLAFFKTGLVTFGGGYAMLPILKDELVVKKNWLSEEELFDYFSIGSCTPGIIAINVATFCGYKLKKTSGAIIATLGMVLPSVMIITLIFFAWQNFQKNENITHILSGVRLGVIALLLKVVFDFAKQIIKTKQGKIYGTALFALALLCLLCFKLSAPLMIVLALFLSVMLYIFQRR